MRAQTLALVFALTSSLAIVATSSVGFAAAHSEPDYPNEYAKEPANKYSGNTPVDNRVGLLMNNGTFGKAQPNFEAWAKAPVIVAGISEQTYSYRQRDQLIVNLKEQVQWGKAALANWKTTSSITRPEVIEYSKQAIAALSEPVKKLENATGKLSGASEGQWTAAESDARAALIDFRTVYTQLHKNSKWVGHAQNEK